MKVKMVHKVVAWVCLLFGFASANAALLVTEDFYYPEKTTETALAGESGGTGWSGAWAGNVNVLYNGTINIAHGGYPLEQAEGSGSLYSTTANYRAIYRNLESALSGEVWFSYVFRQGGSVGAGGLMFNATAANDLTPETPTDWNVLLAPGGNLNVTVNGATTTVASGLANAVDYLVVGRMVTGSDGEFDLWFNPDLTGISNIEQFLSDMTPDFSESGVVNPDEITSLGVAAYYSGGSGTRVFRFDALRLTDAVGNEAFEHITGIPEPATLSLLLTSAATVLILRRRLQLHR